MQPSDLLLLAFKGIAIASLPLAAVWVGRGFGPNRREGGDRLRRLAWVTAFLTFDLVVFGGFTRLTDSGLGCPDWPGCYARADPFMASGAIREAEAAMPGGPVTMGKAWIEMIHRYLAMAVGALIVAMLVSSLVRRLRSRSAAFPATAAALLALVVVQGAFGAWTVTQKLQPIFVTAHLLLGLSLLALLVRHALLFEPTPRVDAPKLRALGRASLVVLALQVALGGWVSANYAVLACTDFPTCHGVWVPTMDFADAFHPWRALGRTASGAYLSLDALTAIHWAHRCFAIVAFVVLGLLAWRSRRHASTRTAGTMLAALLLAQGSTGAANVVFAWPLVAAVLHDAGAAGLVACLVVINSRLRPHVSFGSARRSISPALSPIAMGSTRGGHKPPPVAT